MKYFLTKHTNHAPFPLFSAGRHTQRSSWWLQPFRARQIFSAKHTSLKHSSWIFNISRASSVPKWAEGFLPAPQGIHSQRSRSAVDHCTLMPPVDSQQHIFKFHHIFLFKIVLRIIQRILNPCSALLHNCITGEYLTLCRLCNFSFTSFSRAKANSIAEITSKLEGKT